MTTTLPRPSQPLPSDDAGQPADPGAPSPTTARPVDGERPGGGERSARRRRSAINPASAHALAMLTLQPVFSASVPRLHIGPTGTDGSRLVEDRASGRRFRVYTPRIDAEFRAGHRAGLWYVRTSCDGEASPRSPGFPNAAAAIDSIHSARAGTPQQTAHRPRCRVLWS